MGLDSLGTSVSFLMASLVLMVISYPVSVMPLAAVVWEFAFLVKQITPLLCKGNFWQKESVGGGRLEKPFSRITRGQL